jgi:hypothetical protein
VSRSFGQCSPICALPTCSSPLGRCWSESDWQPVLRARKRAFQALADGLAEAEREALDALLAVDPELRRSRFAWLRDYSESPAPSNIIELLNRLEYVRCLKIGPERAGCRLSTAHTHNGLFCRRMAKGTATVIRPRSAPPSRGEISGAARTRRESCRLRFNVRREAILWRPGRQDCPCGRR